MGELLSVGYAAIDKINGNEYFGGAAAGIAINGKRLGLDTGLLALFGDDKQSRRFQSYLSELGIDLSPSLTLQQTELPVNNLLTDNISGWDDHQVARLIPSVTLNEKGLNSYEIVHLASPHPELVRKVVETKTNGIMTYTPGPLITLNADNLNISALRNSTILFLNEDEWQVVRRQFNINTPDELINLGPQIVVTTLGDKGALIFHRTRTKRERIIIPSSLVEKPETTGAGDAFSLGFLFGYFQGLSLDICGNMGSKLASHAVKRNGVIIEEDNLDRFKREFTA